MNPENVLSIFAVVRTTDVKNALVSSIPAGNGTKLNVQVGELKSLAGGINFGDHVDVLLFDVNMEDPEDLETLQRIKREEVNGRTAIIATSEKASTSSMRRLLRDGIDDFLPQPLSPSEVTETLHAVEKKLRQYDHAMEDKGHVYSFLKASGGMGATTLAVHTACALTKRRRKDPERSVCLIDLDIQFGGAGLYLDLEGSSALVDIVRQPERLDAELLRGVMVRHKSGFDVLTAPALPMPLDALRPDVVMRLMELAQQEYDFVVVDLPHALTHWTDAVLTRSSVLALVTQLTVPAIRQTRKLLQLLEEEGHYTLPLALVLNRYKKQWGSGVHLRQAEKALGHKFDYIVPNDYGLVTAALNQGVSAFEIRRRSRFAKSVLSMTEKSHRKLTMPLPARTGAPANAAA